MRHTKKWVLKTWQSLRIEEAIQAATLLYLVIFVSSAWGWIISCRCVQWKRQQQFFSGFRFLLIIQNVFLPVIFYLKWSGLRDACHGNHLPSNTGSAWLAVLLFSQIFHTNLGCLMRQDFISVLACLKFCDFLKKYYLI